MLFAAVFWQIHLIPNWRLHLQNIKGEEGTISFEWHSPHCEGCILTTLTQRMDNTPPLLSQKAWLQSSGWHPVPATDGAGQCCLFFSLHSSVGKGGYWATFCVALLSLALSLTLCWYVSQGSICSKSITWHWASEKLSQNIDKQMLMFSSQCSERKGS